MLHFWGQDNKSADLKPLTLLWVREIGKRRIKHFGSCCVRELQNVAPEERLQRQEKDCSSRVVLM